MDEPERQVNVPLLRKAVEWAEAEAAKPEQLSQWYQGMWEVKPEERKFYMALRDRECGTTYCIAGYVCQSQGIEPVPEWGTAAARELGINYDPSADSGQDESYPSGNRLFCANNSIEDVRRIAEEIAGERL